MIGDSANVSVINPPPREIALSPEIENFEDEYMNF